MDPAITQWLVNGAIYAAVSLVLATLIRRYTRELLVALLVVADAAYVWFAVDAREGPGWIAAELVAGALFGLLLAADINR